MASVSCRLISKVDVPAMPYLLFDARHPVEYDGAVTTLHVEQTVRDTVQQSTTSNDQPSESTWCVALRHAHILEILHLSDAGQ